MQLKEKKEMDEQFKKAQKPWSKLLLKLNKAKADYHTACKQEKTAVNIERNAGGDSSLSQDHVSNPNINTRFRLIKETIWDFDFSILGQLNIHLP